MQQPGRSRQSHVEERWPDGDTSPREVHQRIEDDRARVVRRRETRTAQVIVVVRGQGPRAASRGELLAGREAQTDADRERGGEAQEEDEPPQSHQNDYELSAVSFHSQPGPRTPL